MAMQNPSILNTLHLFVLSITLSATLISYPQKSVAEGFKASDVLKWDQSQQDWYFQVSVGMAAVIAAQNRGEQGSCIDKWYFAGSNKVTVNEKIRETFARFPTYHPAGVLLALVEKECGQLKFTK